VKEFGKLVRIWQS